MSEDNKVKDSTRATLGFLGWLTLGFVVLKLDPGQHLTSDVVNWSWWLVFSPVIIGYGIVLLFLAVTFSIWGVIRLKQNRETKRRREATWKKLNVEWNDEHVDNQTY